MTLGVETAKPGMPAFAAYVAGTVKTGKAMILVNLDASLWSLVEHPDLGFRRLVIDCLAHEFIHALEEKFGLLFDEEAVEASIARVRAEQKPKRKPVRRHV
jgi:hypothetical protein